MLSILRFLTPKSGVVCLLESYTVRQTIEKMHYHRHHAVPVINEEGRYVGTLNSGDILRLIVERGSYDLHAFEHMHLSELIDKDNPPVHSDATMEELLERVKLNAFVPVVDDRGVFIGIVTRRDVINYFIDDYMTPKG